jgi:ABC-type Mn2+/Zn2+ transport system ATPase subunit
MSDPVFAAAPPARGRAASAHPAPAIVAERLSVSYDGRPALVDVSFSVPPGQLVGVLGPNGAGKSTLLRALLGTVAHRGSAVVRGPTGYVPQLGAVHPTFPVDALGVVLMGRYPRLGWRRRPGAADRRMALQLLDRMGLAERGRSAFGSLSGGQRQRVLVARALAQEGDVLLLDEPLTGTDATSQGTILGVLAEQRDQGRTVCMSTHDLAMAGRSCDRLLLLDTVLVADGPTREVFRPEILARVYRSELVVLDGHPAVLDPGGSHAGA